MSRGGLAIVLGGALALLAPAGAQAGTAQVRQVPIPDSAPGSKLEYTASPGQVNRLTGLAAATAAAVPAGPVTLSDPAGIDPGPGCVRPVASDLTSVRCRPANYPQFGAVRVTLGDGADTASFRGPAPDVRLEGGEGDDALAAELGDGWTATFIGGPGDDRLTGGTQYDSFSEGSSGSGSDTLSGGGADDTVDYSRRRRGVRASLDGRRNDGQRGERDLIQGVENIHGGRGRDRLIGSRADNLLAGGRGSDRIQGGAGNDELQAGRGRARDRLAGGSGRDELRGSSGRDRLIGGSGNDQLSGGGGSDRLSARDRSTDKVSCGRGRDRIRLDRLDVYSRGCERVHRRGAASAVITDITVVTEQGPNNSGTSLPSAGITCPLDGPRRCLGRARIMAGSRVLGRARFRLRRGDGTQIEGGELPAGLPDRRLVVILRTRDAHGRRRTIMGNAASLPGERS